MKAREIFEYLEESIGLAGPPVRIQSAIESALVSHFRLPPIKAAEIAESRAKQVALLIEKKQSIVQVAGKIAPLCLIGSASDIVAGSCHVLVGDTVLVVQAKTHRLNAIPLHSRIMGLTFNEFELFGSKVLRELGASNATVTPHSNDQGVDFYGNVSFGQLHGTPANFFQLTHEVQIRFAGQAKHYPTNALGTAVVRELIGSIELARFKTYSVDKDPFENIDLKPFSPVVAMLFTSGRFTAGARELAARAGIVAKDGLQLATFLADRGVGMIPSSSGSAFDTSVFEKWLHAP